MKTPLVLYVSLALAMGSTYAAKAPSAASPQTAQNVDQDSRLVAYLQGPKNYPLAIKQAIHGYAFPWDGATKADVLVLPVTASEDQARAALKANSEGATLVLYKGSLRPSPGFMKVFVAISGDYLEILKGGDARHAYAYNAGQLATLNKAFNKQLTALSAVQRESAKLNLLADSRAPSTGGQLSHKTVNGENLTQFQRDFDFKVDTDGASGDYYADVVLQLTGTRHDSAATEKNQIFWTASVQGSGFNGQPLYQEDYVRDGSVSNWRTLIPLNYTVSLALGQGNSTQSPIVEGYAPSNKQISSDYTVSTGWSVGGALTANTAAGPTPGVNASITNSESRKLKIDDSTLTTTVDLKNQKYTWDLRYTSFGGYSFKGDGALAFVAHNTSASDSNMLLNHFDDLAPTMQAYEPMYNVLYVTADADRSATHTLTLSIAETEWHFQVQRDLATWEAEAISPAYPKSSTTYKILVYNTLEDSTSDSIVVSAR